MTRGTVASLLPSLRSHSPLSFVALPASALRVTPSQSARVCYCGKYALSLVYAIAMLQRATCAVAVALLYCPSSARAAVWRASSNPLPARKRALSSRRWVRGARHFAGGLERWVRWLRTGHSACARPSRVPSTQFAATNGSHASKRAVCRAATNLFTFQSKDMCRIAHMLGCPAATAARLLSAAP